MTAMTAATAHQPPSWGPSAALSRALRNTKRVVVLAAVIGLTLLAAGCGTSHPKAISAQELAEAQTFPYFRIYWVGPRFDGRPLAAADGLNGYISGIGDSVYYGDCVQHNGIFGGGSCELPLQVTTVIYGLHSNSALGPQHNILVRGVPATVYDGGRSIEIYSGRVAIDIFSNSYDHALQAATELSPLNAPGLATGNLPAPVYCPGLSGPQEPRVQHVMASLPGHACQHAAAQLAYTKSVSGRVG
jgi:hypothetical protein